MIVSNSGLYNIGLDLRRGLTNKRFWSTLGVLAFVFSLFIGLRGIWPLTTYYYGGDAGYRAYVGRMFTQKIIIQSLIDLAVFANYFPFFGAVAFAYTIVDDRRHGYCLQQIQRIGFSKYYWSKLTASGILGGLMGTMCIVLICLLSAILVAWNPFTKEAVAYYNSWTDYDNIIGYVGWGYDGAYFYVENQWVWWMLGCIKYFVMGTFFGFLAGIIAFPSVISPEWQIVPPMLNTSNVPSAPVNITEPPSVRHPSSGMSDALTELMEPTGVSPPRTTGQIMKLP